MAAEITYDKDQLRYKPKSEAMREAALEFSEEVKEQPVLKEAAEFQKNVLEQYIKYFGYVAPPFPLLGFDPLAFVPLRNIKSLFKKKGDFADIMSPLLVRRTSVQSAVWYELPNMPMVSVRGSKNVVFTEISRGIDKNGKSKIGTVKEETYQRDWQIEISGIIIGEKENELPTDDINELYKYFKMGEALEVRHDLLNAIDISFIKVLDLDLPTNEGEGENVQTFIIRAMSDEDFETELLG